MSYPTGVLLLHVLQQLKLDLTCLRSYVVCKTNCCMSGSSSTALCARNAHITLNDVTTWSWVNLVNPIQRGPPWRVSAYKILKSTGFHVDFGFQIGFLYLKWISGFQSGFLDFCIIFKVDLDFWAEHMAYKYMHEQICMHDIWHTSPQKTNDLCTRLKIGWVQKSLLCGDVAITSYQNPCTPV